MIDFLQFVTLREAYHNGWIEYEDFRRRHTDIQSREQVPADATRVDGGNHQLSDADNSRIDRLGNLGTD